MKILIVSVLYFGVHLVIDEHILTEDDSTMIVA